MDKICEDLNLSEYQVRQTLDTLKSHGIISVTKKGIPCKNYYTINEDKIIEVLEMQNTKTSSLKTTEQELENFEDSTSKYCTTFSRKKDKKKDMEKEDNNIVPPPSETSVNSELSVNDTVQTACLDEVRQTYKEVHRRWTEANLPLSRASATSYLVFSSRELKNALGFWSGMYLQPQDYLDALENYIELAKLISSGGSWMDHVGNFEHFSKRILDFLPGTFDIDRYRKRSAREIPAREDSQLSVNELMEKYGIEENH